MRSYYDAELRGRTAQAPDSPRSLRLADFVDVCRTRRLTSVLEVGSGAGHDARVLGAAGLRYTGVDLSAVGVALAGRLGLQAVEASAVALPFRDEVFDAAWSMSTLMHLPGEDIVVALGELARVVRPGGLLEVGVWGAEEEAKTWFDDQGRHFRLRTDVQMTELLAGVGDVEAFATWDHRPNGGHYQWARVTVGVSHVRPSCPAEAGSGPMSNDD